MDFTKYSSLTNVSQKFIDKITELGYANIPYIVNEKVHGANFGIHWDAENGVRFSKRSGFLEEGEVFYAHTKIADELSTRILAMANELDVTTISVYGEIFGGSFYGDQEVGSKKIQKEVEYSPKTEFMAFDLITDGNYMCGQGSLEVLDLYGFQCPPYFGKFNSLQEALQVANDMDSEVPDQLGFTAKEGNIMEGVVIKPAWDDIILPNGKRLIIKNKNSKFSEKNNTKEVKVPVELSDHAKTLVVSLSTYINPNRLSNVLSKEGILTAKDFGRILGLFVQDAISEWNEDTGNKFKEVLDGEYKQALKLINNEARSTLLEVWVDYLEDQQ